MPIIFCRLFQSGGNKVRTEFTPSLKRKAFRYLRERPHKYKECIRDLNLHFVIDYPSGLKRIYEKESLSCLGIKKSSSSKPPYRQPILGFKEDECRQFLRAVMEFMDSTKVTAFGRRSIDWERIYADLGKSYKRKWLQRTWGSIIFPVLSKYCAGVSVDPKESENKILEHIRDTVDSLERIDIDELTSVFPFETYASISGIIRSTKMRLESSNHTKGEDFTSKMNAIIGSSHRADKKKATRCRMIARIYKEVSEELERKWAQSHHKEN